MTGHHGNLRHLHKGDNLALSALGIELGGLTVLLDSRGRDGQLIDADVSVLLLDDSGSVRSSNDFVFYNQPIALSGAVHLRDKLRADPGGEDDEAGWTSDVVTVELDDVPDEIQRIVLAASIDPSTGHTFGDAAAVRLRIQRTSDATDLLVYDIDDATSELALLFGEFYRRNGEWKIRAVGQGYASGLEALVRDHGVDVEPASEGSGADISADTEPTTAKAETPNTAIDGAIEAIDAAAHVDPPEAAPRPSRGVSVRRPVRAPRLAADWNTSIPAVDGNDWQPARLFPVAGIGGGEEQERRATSALLAVMGVVREFGAALTTRCGAPRGALETFIEVPFGQDEEAYRPDGVLRVTRGQRSWTALVEVKTSTGRLDAAQIEAYVDIARSKGFDAVITISNELTGGDADHPVAVDRRKLRKVALHHLSWDQIRAEAVLISRHRGVADATQGTILEEFVRYMAHARSGMGGLGDMGSSWVKVRESVRAKTARAGDKAIGDISARYDELVQHLGHHLTGLLGVEVLALPPRETPDHASRRQQLADSGLLFGRLKVPGAIDVVVIGTDLRADKVSAAITVPAPRGETRPLTRVNWLLRQLPDTARESIRVDAHLAGARSTSTSALLGKARQDPAILIPEEAREIRAFTISLDAAMGAKRAAGTGTLIGSVKEVTTTFYADVVQHLRPWSEKRS